ncbi:hypothetical protein CRUP_007937, partial [Coryphaenoides rupestris]
FTGEDKCVRSREAKRGRRRAEWGGGSGSRGPPEVLGEVQSVLVVPHAWRGVAKPAGVVVFNQWLRLPDEVWLCVLSLLPHAHLSSVAQVCHRMHRLAHDHTLSYTCREAAHRERNASRPWGVTERPLHRYRDTRCGRRPPSPRSHPSVSTPLCTSTAVPAQCQECFY